MMDVVVRGGEKSERQAGISENSHGENRTLLISKLSS